MVEVLTAMIAAALGAAATTASTETVAPVMPAVKILPSLQTPAQAIPAAAVAAAPAPTEKLVCRKQEVIGSLIAKKRVCMTAQNWARHQQRAQDDLQLFTQPGAISPNGPDGAVAIREGFDPINPR